jgi:probable HAF family extracellular repeat protein
MQHLARLSLIAAALCGTSAHAQSQARFDLAVTHAAAPAAFARLTAGHYPAMLGRDRLAVLAASRRANAAAPMAPPPPTSLPSGVTFLDYPGAAQTIFPDFNLGARRAKKQYFAGGYDNTLSGGYSPTALAAQLAASPSGVNESFQTILPGTSVVAATGVNDANDIVGWVQASNTCATDGFVLSKGVETVLSPPFDGVNGAVAEGINDAGLVVGLWYSSSDGSCTPHGFTWKNGTYTTRRGR